MDTKENKKFRSKEEIEEEDKLFEKMCGNYNDYTDGNSRRKVRTDYNDSDKY